MSGHLWTFLGISFLVIAAPGPDTALTIRNSLLGGRRSGIFTALGVSAGQAIWALATSAGIASLLLASAILFAAIKLLGAGYLVFLGLEALWQALGPARGAAPLAKAGALRLLAPANAFRQGVVSNLANPKMAVFFMSLLPQFAPAGSTSFTGLASLGAVFSAMTLVWLAGYALAIARAGDFLRRPTIKRWLAGITGAALIALGLRLASEPR
jgi:threonine/homoserine/homoserine lactone efflux protein